MTTRNVLQAMPKRNRCPVTGLEIPECSCRRCCLALVRRFAPQLIASPTADPSPGQPLPPVSPVEAYASAHGVSVSALRQQARERHVIA